MGYLYTPRYCYISPLCFTAQRRLEVHDVAHGRGAGHPQHIPLAPLPQFPAKPCVATQLIIAGHPAMGHLITPRLDHLQALIVSRVIPHRLGHMALLASWLVSCPLLREGQAEVEQGM